MTNLLPLEELEKFLQSEKLLQALQNISADLNQKPGENESLRNLLNYVLTIYFLNQTD